MTADCSHIELTYVTACYFDGPGRGSVADLLRRYNAYAPAILDRIQFVLVDDASPDPVALPDDVDLNIRLLRINENIPWNQPGARNLGAVYARSDKIFMTDLDHALPEATFSTLVRRRNPGRTFYKFHRQTTAGEVLRPHPNTFFLSRARFLRWYGYDEDFCGHYGHDDPMFWRWQRLHGTRFLYLPRSQHVVYLGREGSPLDHTLARDLSHNAAVAAAKKAAWREFGAARGHSRRFLDFTWQTVADRRRSTPIPPPPQNRHWLHTWWWRWIAPA
jgi:glycosyltransferase involved in cell wall biosynthesis